MVHTWGKRAAAFALASTVVIGACSSDNDRGGQASVKRLPAQEAEGYDAGASVSEAQAVADGAAVADTAFANAAGGAEAVQMLPASVSQPRIVKNGTLRLEVAADGFSKAFSEVATIASSAGGFVASSNSAAGDGEGLAAGSLTLRVPADAFDAVRQKIRDLGELQGEEITGDDVGAQITDLEARLRNLRAQEEAIRALMAKATDVPQTLQVQGQLSAVREQIEQLDAQRARLEDAVTFATLTVQLSEPGATPRGEQSSIAEAVERAVDGAETMIAGAIVAVGYLLPIAIVVLLVLAVRRAITLRPRSVATAPAFGSGEDRA